MKSTACNPKKLDKFLHGEMNLQEEAEFTSHLDQCDSCGIELERQAGKPTQWQEAKQFLTEPTSATGAPGLPNQDQLPQDGSVPLPVRQVIDLISPTDHPESLGRVDGFEILGVVGSGAMGVVLKAEDPHLDRVVALKVMNPSLAASGTARQRFAREAKAAAGILHPNVIAIHGVSTEYQLPYLVMPYLKGISLQQRVDRDGPLSLTEILRIGGQLAAGLTAAHQIGLIHRDIKPANVMLDDGIETAVITDFGLARTIDDATMTRSGAITGTPEFMSPEQARGESIEFSSDLFSLGSVLYTLCTGRPPFRAQTAYGVIRKIIDERPTPIREINPDIPDWLCRIIERLHEKSASLRPTAEHTHKLLELCLAHVYQPDQIQLPVEVTDQAESTITTSFRSFYIGACTMAFISTILLVTYIMVPGFFAAPPAEPDSDPTSATQTRQDDSTSEYTVHQTIERDFPAPDQPKLVVIDINRGFVEVTSHDEPGVIIEVLNPPDSDQSDGANSELKTQFAPKFDLDVKKSNNCIKLDTYNQDYVLNLRVKVPRETNLSLDTYYDGYLKATDISGTIKTHSQHGDIILNKIAGSATAYSRNGIIKVDFTEVSNDAQLDFESYNGSIYLTFPGDFQATTAVKTGRGTYSSAFEIQAINDMESMSPERKASIEKAQESGYRTGTINGGGIPLRIESEKGEIEIRKAMPDADATKTGKTSGN